MCFAITPAGNRRAVFLGLLGVLLLTPSGLVRAQADPEDQPRAEWAPARNAVGVGLHWFLEDGESGRRIGIWWTANRNLTLGATWRAWDHFDVIEPEIRLQSRRRRRVSPFLSLSGFQQRHGSRKGTGVGAGIGVEGYPVQGLALYGALGGRTIWEEGSTDEDDSVRSSWFRLHTGILVFPVDVLRAATNRDRARTGEGRRVQVSGGLGSSFPGSGRDEYGVGAGVALESVSVWNSWFSGRLYAGGFYSSTAKRSCAAGVEPCSVSSQIAVAGAKIRLLVPIPHVGPFFELGAGISAGAIETKVGGLSFSQRIDESHTGLMTHIPVSVGIAFGAEHKHDLSLDYFIHRGKDHIVGMLALGFGFVLGGE